MKLGNYEKNKLDGQRFGNLTVLKRVENRSRYRKVVYLCRCDCGREVEVRKNYLIHNEKTHCGCKTRSAREKVKIQGMPFEFPETLDLTDNGALLLCEGIVRQAASDYRQAAIELWKLEHDAAAYVKLWSKNYVKGGVRTKPIDSEEAETKRQIKLANCKKTMAEVEKFFCGEWFEMLANGISGKDCFERMKRVVEEEILEIAETKKKRQKRNIGVIDVERKCKEL